MNENDPRLTAGMETYAERRDAMRQMMREPHLSERERLSYAWHSYLYEVNYIMKVKAYSRMVKNAAACDRVVEMLNFRHDLMDL